MDEMTALYVVHPERADCRATGAVDHLLTLLGTCGLSRPQTELDALYYAPDGSEAPAQALADYLWIRPQRLPAPGRPSLFVSGVLDELGRRYPDKQVLLLASEATVDLALSHLVRYGRAREQRLPTTVPYAGVRRFQLLSTAARSCPPLLRSGQS